MTYPEVSLDVRSAAAFGLLPGLTRVAALGTVLDVDPGTVPEDVWTNGGRYPWLPTATALQLRSTDAADNPSGIGASRVLLNVLDSQLVQRAVIVTLNGITPVALPSPVLRINSMIVLAMGSAYPAGATSTNVGDLILEDVAGATLRGIVQAGVGITQQSCYTVPFGFSLGIYQLMLDVRSPSGALGQMARMVTYFKSPAGGSRTPLLFGNTSASPYAHSINPPIVITAGTDFSLLVTEVSDNNSVVTAAWNGVLRAL